jgi:hypothetical protein
MLTARKDVGAIDVSGLIYAVGGATFQNPALSATEQYFAGRQFVYLLEILRMQSFPEIVVAWSGLNFLGEGRGGS